MTHDEMLAKIVTRKLNGGTPHEVWSVTESSYGFARISHMPLVGLSNISDGYYTQWFRHKEEAQHFLSLFQHAMETAWP